MKIIILLSISTLLITLPACSPSQDENQSEILSSDELILIEDGTVQEGHTPQLNADIIAAQKELTKDKIFDVDLTKMSNTIIYSQIYDIVANQKNYINKTINLVGTLDSQYYDSVGQTLSFIIINDAIGCCPQGLELRFPDDVELPATDTIIGVQGTMITYTEEENEFFCIWVEELTTY